MCRSCGELMSAQSVDAVRATRDEIQRRVTDLVAELT